jgi:mannose-6-phosphate isomerase-like protein (cupin superfamily)
MAAPLRHTVEFSVRISCRSVESRNESNPTRQVDQKTVEKKWEARGFSCDLWIDAPGRVWRDFIHETDELVMLVEGEEEFEMNGQIHRLQIGQELLIPAGIYHTARNVGRNTSKWLYGYKGR